MADEVASAETPATEDARVPVAPDGKPIMEVKVYAPFKVYFEGDAFSISAVNATGPFDVLPHHKNFLCMLVPCDLQIGTAGGELKTIKIHRALMHVKADRVVVFVDV